MEYYYAEGEQQLGPFTLEELKAKSISKSTKVSHEGLEYWVQAGEVDELKGLFKAVPPPLNVVKATPPPLVKEPIEQKATDVPVEVKTPIEQKTTDVPVEVKTPIEQKATDVPVDEKMPTEQKYTEPKPERFAAPTASAKKGKKLIAFVVAVVTVFGLIALVANLNRGSSNSYSSNSYNDASTSTSYSEPISTQENSYTPPKQNRPRQKSEYELRQELHNREKQRPTQFLSVSYDIKYKLLSGKDQVKGRIYNSASVATFKDVILTVTCLTNTGAVLSTNDYAVYEYVYPQGSRNFDIRFRSPRGTKRIGVNVKHATGE